MLNVKDYSNQDLIECYDFLHDELSDILKTNLPKNPLSEIVLKEYKSKLKALIWASLNNLKDNYGEPKPDLLAIAKKNATMVYDLDEDSGVISLDSYIVNYLEYDNASHLDEILTKVPAEKFIERLKELKDPVDLQDAFIGPVNRMIEAVNEFEKALYEKIEKLNESEK